MEITIETRRHFLKLCILSVFTFSLETGSFVFTCSRKHWFEHDDGTARRWVFEKKVQRSGQRSAQRPAERQGA
ncbi:hypothetical protein V6L77_10340 [Pannonibacter sp. Pt2-lr]|uniref:Uncharacterized protein n=1 Tax=Pannonibacter anstelovis TaxID=3121537 RepID=A0ABU7ZQR8_9HYPH